MTAKGPVKRTLTIPADAIAPNIWAIKTKAPRVRGRAPIRHNPKVTCQVGVNMDLLRYLITYCWIEKTTGDSKENPSISS